MRPAPADQRLIGRPLGVAAIVFAAACGGSTSAPMDAGVDAAASDALAETAPQTGDDGAAMDSGGANCDPTGATLAPTNDPACPPRGMNPAAGSTCSVQALRCTYFGYGGACLPGVPYPVICCDGKWRLGVACPTGTDASAD